MAKQYINVQRKAKEDRMKLIAACLGVLFLLYICGLTIGYMERKHIENDAFFLNTISAVQDIGMHWRPWPTWMNLFGMGDGDLVFKDPFFKCLCLYGVILTFIIFCFWSHAIMNAHFNEYETAGSAKFQDASSIKLYNTKFTEPVGKPYAEGNMNSIYGEHTFLSIDTGHTKLNNNAMIIGAPGTGKSFGIVRPNVMQMNSSYVITDPSGELLKTMGKMLEKGGYTIKVFDLTDMKHSHRYNPFHYIRTEQDVLTLIQCYINSTNGNNVGAAGDSKFWEDSEKALLSAIIFYLLHYGKPEEQNFATIAKWVRDAKPKEGAKPGKVVKTVLDEKFDALRDDEVLRNDICLKNYDTFKLAPEKTTSGILISTSVRLAPFNMDTVANLTNDDEMELERIADEPTAVFIIVPQGENAYSFLVNMLYSQMFDTLYYHGSHDFDDGRLPYDVRFVLDEFANIGVIPSFQQKLTTMRKYGLSCMIFIQSVGQIKNLYKDDYSTLIDACSTFVYLGGADNATMKDVQEKLGVSTIRKRNLSSSKNANGGGSDSKSFDYTKRDLLTLDEIRRLRSDSLLVIISGQQPFYDTKYNPYTMHPRREEIGNLKTGDNLYIFDHCNSTVDEDEKLDDMRRKYNELKRKQQADKNQDDMLNNIDSEQNVDGAKATEKPSIWHGGGNRKPIRGINESRKRGG